MTAFLVSLKPKGSPSDPPPSLESVIAVPTHTPDGRRIRIQDGKVVVESKMSKLIFAQLLLGNIVSISWFFMDFNFCLIEYVAPLMHCMIFLGMVKGNKDTINLMLILTIFNWLLLSKLVFERFAMALPFFANESFYTAINPDGLMFQMFTWPLIRVFTLWMIACDIFLYGLLLLQCKTDEEILEGMIQKKSEEALQMV